MENNQNNSLTKQLSSQVSNIFRDFNEVLIKYGFTQTHVVSFTVQQSTLQTEKHENLQTEGHEKAVERNRTSTTSTCTVDKNGIEHCTDTDESTN